MCEELQNGSLPILIQTPNGREDTGTNRDCFILNPSATSKIHMRMFEFLGMNYQYLFFVFIISFIVYIKTITIIFIKRISNNILFNRFKSKHMTKLNIGPLNVLKKIY